MWERVMKTRNLGAQERWGQHTALGDLGLSTALLIVLYLTVGSGGRAETWLVRCRKQ